jgi:pimeloyl-ACP methyl ester carboxylesterase
MPKVEKLRSWFRTPWVFIPLALVVAALLFVGAVSYYHLRYTGHTEPIEFSNDTVTLAGVLVKPGPGGPYPAIVVVHGSGRESRGLPGYRVHTNLFVRRGFAVLSYDKRGVGESTGDFDAATIRDFASDAAAAVRYLRTRSDIQPNAIGLFGASEGGWITPLVAVEEDAAFVINKCGPPLPWGETVLFEDENELVAEGIAKSDIKHALALRRRIWEHYRRAIEDSTFAVEPDREAIEAEIERARESDWYSKLPLELVPNNREAYAEVVDWVYYDPRPYLEQLEVPLLAVLAGRDVNIPSERSAATLEAIKRSGDKHFTIQIYPHAGHSLGSWKWPHRAGYIPGYFELIGGWAEARVSRS